MNTPREFNSLRRGPIWRLKICHASISRYLATTRGKNLVIGLLGLPYLAGLLYKTYVNVFDNPHVMSSMYELTDEYDDPVEIESPLSDIVKTELSAYEAQAESADEECFRMEGKEKKKYLIVHSNDLDYHTLGNASHFQGCSVALPYYLNFSKLEDVDDKFLFIRPPSSGLTFRSLTERLKIDLRGAAGRSSPTATLEQLRRSLVLSDGAKRFAVRRAFHQANSQYSALEAGAFTLPAAVAVGGYMLVDAAIRKAKMFGAQVRLPVAVLLLALAPIIYKISDRYVNVMYLASLDSQIVQKDPTYKAGAVEFFEKQLSRNKALKQIFNDRGETMFTDEGDLKHVALKISERLRLIKELDVTNVAQ